MKKSSKRSKLTSRTYVPDLTGLTRAQAEAALTAAGLKFTSSSIVTNYSNEDQKFTSLPTYTTNQVVPRETTIDFVYKAYQGIAVPNVNGLSQTAATTAITGAGLVVGTVSGTTGSDSSLDQKITGQSVSAGSLVDRGTTINLTLYTYVAPYNNPYSNPPPYGNYSNYSNYDNYSNYGNYNNYSNVPADPPSTPPADPPISVTWKSLGVHTLVRTPEGLVAAGSLKVGDVLISANIEGVPYMSTPESFQSIYNWTDSNPNIEYTTTTVVMVHKKIGDTVVAINGDIFSQYHYVLVKRDGLARFIATGDIVESDQIYSYASNSFVPITMLQSVPVSHEIISIDCEPYDIFFTSEMLVHDSVSI
jgi:hypothetical protein